MIAQFEVYSRVHSRGRAADAHAMLLVLLTIIIVGCSNTIDAPAPATSSGETLTGTVRAYSSNSDASVSPAGIVVSLQGTSYHTSTDTSGHFTIESIPAGVYNIIFSKPGYDSMIYPAHHLIGVGTDIINDAYLIEQSDDSISLTDVSYVFTVSVSKVVHVIDTIFRDSSGIIDTVVLTRDSISITYDTVQNANALIIHGTVAGKKPPGDLFVYSSLDSALFPTSRSPQSAGMTEDAWLAQHQSDPVYHQVFQSPIISSGTFTDTLSRDASSLLAYALPAGRPVYVYVVGHSSTAGLPATNGEYQHFSTTPFGPNVVRIRLVVP